MWSTFKEVRPQAYTVDPLPHVEEEIFLGVPTHLRCYSRVVPDFAELKRGPRSMPRMKQEAPDTDRTMHVVNHIRTLMENGTLQPGDKIPPEREFARDLKISRASLRTGIGYLAAMGVMKVRHGVGTFVADGPPEFGKASLSLMGVLHGFQSWQMFEARLILESHLAELAAERGREEHHTALAEEVAEMFASMENPVEYLIHDVIFHRIIAQASGNPILAVLMETITSALYDNRRKTVEHARDLRESAEMHREIYRAIRTRKPLEARRLMEEHLRAAQTAQGMERSTDRKTHQSASKSKKIRAEVGSYPS
jgi:GntR family transcriptional regulator, transcriptional repressor for pyruvate dehydrogenase complex